MPAVAYPHIVPDAHGVLRIERSGYKVIVLLELIAEVGVDAEYLTEQYDLTLGEAHSLLGYYHDNRAEIDALIAERIRRSEEILGRIPEPPGLERLRRLKAERFGQG